MAKKENEKPKETSLLQEDTELAARVKEMMEPVPSFEGTAADNTGEPAEAATAPEILSPQEVAVDSEVQEENTADAAEPQETNEAEKPQEANEAEEPSATADSNEAVEDTKTAEAVDDIVRSESDNLLKAEDEKILAAFRPAERKTAPQRIKAAIFDLWKNPKKRKIMTLSFIAVAVLAAAVPASRYFVLNLAGIRAGLSVRVVDESTLQPLKNVEVSLGGANARTDENGQASLHKIKLGPGVLKIERRAFAALERKVTIGWGSNPIGEEKLRPTGTQYEFSVKDYVSGKGIAKAEATMDNFSAFSDENGKILLTLEYPGDEIAVKITSDGRRAENLTFSVDSKGIHRVMMVPALKHTYISRRDGRYDVFAAYADGKDEQLVLKGTGNERGDSVLAPHLTKNVVALVSTREGKHNEDGFLLSTLDIIDLKSKQISSVQTSERIQIIGWFGDRLVYVRIVSGASGGNPKRSRLMAYHYGDKTDNELASANYFNDVMAAGDRIYYAPSGAYQKGVNVSLFGVKADGSDRKVILDKEVWNLFRTSFDHISLSVQDEWYDYRIGDERPTKRSGEPSNLKSRNYMDSPNGKKSIWIDNRDGKGALIVYEVASGKETALKARSGLKAPARWLSDSVIVYRIKTETETADYAISLDNTDAEPKKIADVTDTDGIDRWYYY